MYVNPLQERAILNNKDHASLCRKYISFSVENLLNSNWYGGCE